MLRGVLGFRLTLAFEGDHHLVNRGWADAEVFLDIGFGRRPAVQTSIEVNERQILALLGRKSFSQVVVTHAGHPNQLFIRASINGGADECTLPG